MTEPYWKKYLVLKCPRNGNWDQRYASFQDVLDRNELVGKLKGLKLSNVLRRSTLDQETYFVDPQFEVYVLSMGEFLSAGKYSSYDSSSPGNANSFSFHAEFLDGGVSHASGDYFCGSRGTWATGMKAVRLLCFELGLPQPPKRHFENDIPPADALWSEHLKHLLTSDACEKFSKLGFSNQPLVREG